ncbi:MAG: ABC transporter permease [Chlamydiia bacterium]|nr:ABC transporter permease [Chlamydiia bacterium]
MIGYLIRRLLLLPLTLLAIIFVNFVILNLAPGDPVTLAEISSTGEAAKAADREMTRGETHYLQFREHYGLTLPILLNFWPFLTYDQVKEGIYKIVYRKGLESVSDLHAKQTLWGDRARFVMPILLSLFLDKNEPKEIKMAAANLFIRGGTKQGFVGPNLKEREKEMNRQISRDNAFLYKQRIKSTDTDEQIRQKIVALEAWYQEIPHLDEFEPRAPTKVKILFFNTRFWRYLGKVMTLDFGTLRNDTNKTVIKEVGKRIKYSLTLAVVPMLIAFVLCQIFGMIMATHHKKWPDVTLNITFLVLFAIPVFVVAPFLIEKVALHHTLPFTNISIPYSGFHSPEEIYGAFTSRQRLFDIILHIFLPLTAIIYGTLAVQARISRTAILEVLHQDYVRTAYAKGLPRRTILIKHVGRNAAITVVTSLAASLGIILGGSLIVETVFQINGFGRFFYEAIINRDFNVILFSAFAGSFLTLVGYMIADISYTFLDPRVSLE